MNVIQEPARVLYESGVPSLDYSTMVLLVDDQAIVAQAVTRLLADLPDIDLHYCADGNDAIKKTMTASVAPQQQSPFPEHEGGIHCHRPHHASEASSLCCGPKPV